MYNGSGYISKEKSLYGRLSTVNVMFLNGKLCFKALLNRWRKKYEKENKEGGNNTQEETKRKENKRKENN